MWRTHNAQHTHTHTHTRNCHLECLLIVMDVTVKICFTIIFPLVVSSPNTVNWPMSYNNQLPTVQQHFTNIAVIKNVGVFQLIWVCEIHGGMLLMCKNTTMRVYGAWIKRYCVLCSKTYSSSSSLVITSRWFATSRLGAPAFVRLVYWVSP